ncbi:hypothetical protein Moror_1045 [Moniliophthora roreri MCA 2997]|uniref:Uncharacterized protein n=1 Tax=Moniliophthora roreri (strain MCA 2997) TaxID=1381753 RepID=V2XP43_MONRO|nr:hypothetical protein Moror_1045 [Moniliophthora roreri MCA 2997]
MLQHRGFTACIVDVETGRPLPEYLTALNLDKNQVSCWIPSREGQKFSVHWEDLGGDVDTCAYILVDGVVVPGRFLFGIGKTFRSGIRTSETTERPFMFRKVVEHTNSLLPSKDAGMIILKVKRVHRLTGRPPDELDNIPRATQTGRQVGDMYVGFGEERTASEQWNYTWDVKPYDHDNPPGERGIHTHVSFVFRYRSLEFLQAQGIAETPSAPRVSIPAPLPRPRPYPPPTHVPRVSVRRISSAPVVPSSELSSPSTPLSASQSSMKNNQGPDPNSPSSPLANNPYRQLMKVGLLTPNTYRRLPSEMRRATSWMTNDTNLPGVGLIRFDPRADLDNNRITVPPE